MASNAGKVNGVIRSNEPLPLTVDQLTKQWFTQILKKSVKDVEVIEIIQGTASKVLIKLTYQNGTDCSATNVCVKGGFNPDVRESLPFLYAIYRLEAEFYCYLAPKLKIPLPPVLYAGTDTVNGQGIVVMADLKAQGYTFGNPLEAWTVERARMSVEQLATLHASTWGETGEAMSIKDAILGLLAPDEWDKRFAPDAKPPVPEIQNEGIVHGDAHIGNTFMSPAGEPGFLDWQVTQSASAMHDVAYFIGGALSIQDRRAHEKDLLQSYLDALKLAGGPELEIRDVWEEYRRQTFHGFAWALAGPLMQSREIVDAMVKRHCAAIVDHKSIELLEGHEV
ncbi:aminoglycoside phosphotransferase [Fusarium pseudoanthophilum]|uniref:Aminoglycoside phosphotransferase n=1 Tax=Fusarium pseudoanthophilum TaxID=48495 RepID=A0A8H5UL49_9HYPO|nr:aminoglycoside phosphotransferase [Fusarium pseudoanthophilum]